MRFTLLRLKTEPKVYGTIIPAFEGPGYELGHSTTMPDLFGKETTIELLQKQLHESPIFLKQLEQYELVQASLFIIEK